MKRSIGLRTQVAFLTAGSSARRGGSSDQCFWYCAPLFDPRFDDGDFLLRHRLVRLRRRHLLGWIVRYEALIKLAFGRLTGNDDAHPLAAIFVRVEIIIEPQIAFAGRFVRAVAEEAIVRKNWPHVAIEFHWGLRRYGRRNAKAKENRKDSASHR